MIHIFRINFHSLSESFDSAREQHHHILSYEHDTRIISRNVVQIFNFSIRDALVKFKNQLFCELYSINMDTSSPNIRYSESFDDPLALLNGHKYCSLVKTIKKRKVIYRYEKVFKNVKKKSCLSESCILGLSIGSTTEMKSFRRL